MVAVTQCPKRFDSECQLTDLCPLLIPRAISCNLALLIIKSFVIVAIPNSYINSLITLLNTTRLSSLRWAIGDPLPSIQLVQLFSAKVHDVSMSGLTVPQEMQRPIIFIAHSLGGIIVKEVWEKLSESIGGADTGRL